jgi:hypothetical protein
VNGPSGSGNGALDVNGTFVVSGGTLLAAGSSGMAVAPDSTSNQGWLAATFDSVQTAGTTVQVVSTDGTVLATFTATKDFQSLVYSAADIDSGAEYTITTGGTATANAVGGLSAGGDAAGAAVATTATAGEAPAGGTGGGPGGRFGGPGGN